MYYQYDGAPPHVSQIVRQYLNHKFLNWSWQYTELATMVTRSEPIKLPCMGLHESYGECTQGEHERKTTPANSQHDKKHQQHCNAS
jgi:hypothetical protein